MVPLLRCTSPAELLKVLAAVAVIFAGGCSSGSSAIAPPEPPPETGQVVIDMAGDWMISKVERIDGSGRELPFPETVFTPFLSVQLGQAIKIVEGEARNAQTGDRLYERFSPLVPNKRYLNVADGRFWVFDFEFEHETDCYSRFVIRAAFGSVDENTMDGVVEVFAVSSCPSPAVVRPDPNGTFRVRFGRTAALTLEPSAGGALVVLEPPTVAPPVAARVAPR